MRHAGNTGLGVTPVDRAARDARAPALGAARTATGHETAAALGPERGRCRAVPRRQHEPGWTVEQERPLRANVKDLHGCRSVEEKMSDRSDLVRLGRAPEAAGRKGYLTDTRESSGPGYGFSFDFSVTV
jgi:hypothetical protein